MDNPDEKPHASSARSNAAGWGHDVRTSKGRMAMDSRQHEGPCPYRRNLGEDRPRGGRDTANHAGGGRGEGGKQMSGDARDLARLCNTILSRSLAGEKGASFYRDVDEAIALSRTLAEDEDSPRGEAALREIERRMRRIKRRRNRD